MQTAALRWKRGLQFGVAALLLIAVGLLAARHEKRRDTLGELREKNIIKIGYAVEPPFAFLKDGEVTGEAPEVAREVVQKLGIQHIEWRLVEFGSLIDELEQGRIDVIASGMFITEPRKKRVIFSQPTCHVRQAMLVRKGNPANLHSYQDLVERHGVTVAVIDGSVEQRLLGKMGVPPDRLQPVPDALAGLRALESGRMDAMALSSPSLRWMVGANGCFDTEMAEPFHAPAGSVAELPGNPAFAFRRSEIAFRDEWNRVQKSYLGSPRHRETIKSFGFTDAEVP